MHKYMKLALIICFYNDKFEQNCLCKMDNGTKNIEPPLNISYSLQLTRQFDTIYWIYKAQSVDCRIRKGTDTHELCNLKVRKDCHTWVMIKYQRQTNTVCAPFVFLDLLTATKVTLSLTSK